MLAVSRSLWAHAEDVRKRRALLTLEQEAAYLEHWRQVHLVVEHTDNER